jgi:NAD(P)-dependent dehydrogenase (short-subunit alcohol dehydrogenase family)
VQVRDLGLPVLAILGGPVQVQAVADRAVRAYGQLDTWVHMAGVLLVVGFDDTTPEEFARVLQVNLSCGWCRSGPLGIAARCRAATPPQSRAA